jgi:NAD(P)-dependent dehydrogenase (short-subunit alcohol dehydrogenase family)
VDINESAARKVADQICGAGLTAKAFTVDISQDQALPVLVGDVVKTFGRLDILHNNASASSGDAFGRDKALLDLDPTVWDTTFAVNVRAPMLLSKYAIPHMVRQGGGVIVNTSTGASEFPSSDAMTAYGPSKAALNTLTLYIAAQYGAQNIRCNAVLPGVVLTKALQQFFPPQQIEAMASRSMVRRVCLPEDIAATVHFLASDDARQITGQLLRVNGGGGFN